MKTLKFSMANVFRMLIIRLLMISSLILISLFGFFSCNRQNSSDTVKNENLVLVCGDSKVLLVNHSNSNDSIPDVVWLWDAHEDKDMPADFDANKFNSIDDCKAINKGKQIMVSSSSGAVAIVNIEDKKVVFCADVPNAHSIELLPGDKIIAAASTHEKGNKLMLFDIDKPGKLLFSDSLYSAHGVVWDADRNSLFALGYDVLREYKIEDEIKLVLKDEWKIPGIGGHDLQMAPDGDQLFITDHTGSWVFNNKDFQFRKIDNFPDAADIKSLNQNKHGQFVYTIPEVSWWTYHVRFYNPNAVLVFPDMRVYKARWFESN